MRHGRAAAMPARRPARASCHLGGSPCLIDEDELLRLEVGLCLDPCAPSSQHVSALLLAGVRRFFKGDPAAVEEAPRGALGDPQTVLVFQMGGDLRQHHVRGLVHQCQNHLGPCLDPLRAPVAALRSGAPAARAVQASTHLIAVDGAMLKRLAATCRRPPPPSPPGDADHSKEVVSCRLASFTSPHLDSQIQAIENSKDSPR